MVSRQSLKSTLSADSMLGVGEIPQVLDDDLHPFGPIQGFIDQVARIGQDKVQIDIIDEPVDMSATCSLTCRVVSAVLGRDVPARQRRELAVAGR